MTGREYLIDASAYDGLLQLVHTLRAPDVGNRIDEGGLPQILLESLPPLQEDALSRAGEQLDGLTETRLAQRRLEDSMREVDKFLGVYRRYAAETLRARAQETLSAATAVTDATNLAVQRAGELVALQEESELRAAAVQQLTEERDGSGARGEVAVHEVGNVVLPAVALGQAVTPRLGLARLQAQLAHDRSDELRPARHAPGREVRVDAPVPVGLVRGVE